MNTRDSLINQLAHALSTLRLAVVDTEDDPNIDPAKATADTALAAYNDYEAKRPAVVLHMRGGVIESATPSEELDVMVIDYDTQGVGHEVLTRVDLGQDDGEDLSELAIVALLPIEVDEDYVLGRITRYAETEGKEC